MIRYVDTPLKATSMRLKITPSTVTERFLFNVMNAQAHKKARVRNMLRSEAAKIEPPKKRTLIKRGDPRWKE